MSRIIIVPTPVFAPTVNLPVKTNYAQQILRLQNYPDSGLPTPYVVLTEYPNAFVEVPASMPSDPMLDYQSWYDMHGCYTTHVHDDAIRSKFWERHEFNDWIENNIEGTVLVQRMSMYGSSNWRLCFRDGTQHDKFLKWFSKHEKRGTFVIDLSEVEFNEMSEWMKENVKGRSHTLRSYGSQGGRVKTTVEIYDLDEACVFKLKWHQPKALNTAA